MGEECFRTVGAASSDGVGSDGRCTCFVFGDCMTSEESSPERGNGFGKYSRSSEEWDEG
jgi:hypothetical protein